MRKFSRREILKTSVLASAAATVHELAPIAAAMEIRQFLLPHLAKS